MSFTVKVLSTAEVTHDVRRLRVEKPKGYEFVPGQATDVAIDKEGWRDEQRPFTFTSLNEWPELEFTIKIYPDHDGVTRQIGLLSPGDQLIIDEPWGAIRYKGRGCFIAGGAGITPFIAIIRNLKQQKQLDGNRLIFSNKSEKDIILRDEFENASGLECVFTVTDQSESTLAHGTIDQKFLKRTIQDFTQQFYVCGPDQMVNDVTRQLSALGAKADTLTFEE